jgi:hypothetical protein
MPAGRAVLLAVVAALAAPACATLPACPARGGPAWSEWTGPHILLLTDLDDDDAREALRGLEQMRAGVLAAAWRRAPEPSERLTVVVLRSTSERLAFVPGEYTASFVARGHEAFIVKSGHERDDVTADILARALSCHYGFAGKAPWFEEGLARYLESLHVEDDGTIVYGGVVPDLLEGVHAGRLTAFENLWAPQTAKTRQPFIATSWLAVHYLFNHEPERFLAFQLGLVTTKDARAAWRAAFPDLTPEVMDERLAAYAFRAGTFTKFRVQVETPPYEPRRRPLADAQVHALRALLFATIVDGPRVDLARAELAEALRLDPLDVMAAFVERVVLAGDEREVELPKRLVERYPDDPMTWLLLARSRAARGELDEARESWEEVRRFGGAPDGPIAVELRLARPD